MPSLGKMTGEMVLLCTIRLHHRNTRGNKWPFRGYFQVTRLALSSQTEVYRIVLSSVFVIR